MFLPNTDTWIAEVFTPYCTLRFLGIGPFQTTQPGVLPTRLTRRYKNDVGIYHIQMCDIKLNDDTPTVVKPVLLNAVNDLLMHPKVVSAFGQLVHQPHVSVGVLRQRYYGFLTKDKVHAK